MVAHRSLDDGGVARDERLVDECVLAKRRFRVVAAAQSALHPDAKKRADALQQIGEHLVVGGKEGPAKATFVLKAKEAGMYSVQISGVPNKNRSTKTSVSVDAGNDTDTTVAIDQRPAPQIEGVWTQVMDVTVSKDAEVKVVISNEGADGFVIADAVRLLKK